MNATRGSASIIALPSHSCSAPLAWRNSPRPWCTIPLSSPCARRPRHVWTPPAQEGRHLRTTVLHAKGSRERPLSDQEIEVKVRQQAAVRRIDDVIAAAWQIDTLANVGTLLCASC